MNVNETQSLIDKIQEKEELINILSYVIRSKDAEIKKLKEMNEMQEKRLLYYIEKYKEFPDSMNSEAKL